MLSDQDKLKQIIINLLSNAIKFTEEGDVKLSAGLENASLRIIVSDTGIGLEKTDIDRIFNPFEQVESSASRKFQGTGLGLSLTRQLVELHGGKIRVESEGEGKGATFQFAIPI